ncbi:MAG: EamA family transporter [Bacteroidales bacterium]|nr:EamA family transporter [Bacteroidales bacterium]
MSNQLKGIIYASITAFFWGFLAIALKVSTQEFSVVLIVWFRFTFAFIVLFLFFLKTKPQKLKILLKPPLLLIIAALALALNYFGYTTGVQYTSPNTAQVVIQFGPILLGVVGVVFFKESINWLQASGFGVAFIGLTLFYFNQVSAIIDSEIEVFNTGFIWIIIAAIGWLTYASLQKVLVKKYDAQMLNLVIFGLPAILYTPFISASDFQNLNISSWSLLIFLGANTIIAYGSLAMAFKYTDVNKVSVIITLNPIITFITMSILFQLQVKWIETQKMGLETWSGALLVITGALMVVYFKKKPKET